MFHEEWFPYQPRPDVPFDKAQVILDHFRKWKPSRTILIDDEADDLFNSENTEASTSDAGDVSLPSNLVPVAVNPKIGFDSAEMRRALEVMRYSERLVGA